MIRAIVVSKQAIDILVSDRAMQSIEFEHGNTLCHIIKGEMKDSYFEKGKGFGRTYDLLKFPIRIDYILADPEFEVLSHQNFNERLSDHFPVMATLRLNSEQ